MSSNSRLVLLTLLVSSFSSAYAARAEVPVVDLSSRAQTQEAPMNPGLEVDQSEAPSRPAATHQNEPIDQRVLRLERQISNLAEMNYSSKMEKIQQEVAQLHGQIEVQNHELGQLKDQVRNFYQDLDSRLTKIQPETSVGNDKTSTNLKTKPQITAKEPIKEPEADVTANNGKELQSYETAFNLLNKKDYEKAILGFKSFIQDYPSSSYTVNAHYWLGEIYYLKDKPDQANKEFQAIITNYPDNPKVADALLKVALISMDAGNYAKAKVNLAKVQKQFPGSTAAKIATLRLKEIKQKS
jgi:tol-pal system protein YbgF